MATNNPERAPRVDLVISPGGQCAAERPAVRLEEQKGPILFVVGLTLALGVGFLLYRLYLDQMLGYKVSQLRGAGKPASLEELRQSRGDLRSSDNAAHALSSALGEMPELENAPGGEMLSSGYDWPNGPLEAEARAQLTHLLEHCQPVLDQVHAIATRPDQQYQYELWLGNEYSFQFEGWRATTRALQAEAVLFADLQQGDEAIRSLLTLLTMAESLREEPVPSGQRRRRETLNLVVNGLAQVLGRTRLNLEQLERLDAALEKINLREGMLLALGAERAMRISQDNWKASFVRREGRTWLDQLGGKAGAALRYVQMVERAEAIFRLEGMQAYATWTQLMREDELADSFLDEGLFHPYRWQTIESRLLAARAAIAIEKFARTHQSLPRLLSDLVPEYLNEVPLDPFTPGEEFHYRVTEEGYSVYSIGYDQRDGGGDFEVQEENFRRPTLAPDAGLRITRMSAAQAA